MPSLDDRIDTRCDGAAARKAGEPLESNPHSEGWDAAEWSRGWFYEDEVIRARASMGAS